MSGIIYEDLECPYCEYVKPNAEIEFCEEDNEFETVCDNCEKSFIGYVELHPNVTTWKADCLNGGECDWREVDARYVGVHFKECRVCDKKVNLL